MRQNTKPTEGARSHDFLFFLSFSQSLSRGEPEGFLGFPVLILPAHQRVLSVCPSAMAGAGHCSVWVDVLAPH